MIVNRKGEIITGKSLQEVESYVLHKFSMFGGTLPVFMVFSGLQPVQSCYLWCQELILVIRLGVVLCPSDALTEKIIRWRCRGTGTSKEEVEESHKGREEEFLEKN